MFKGNQHMRPGPRAWFTCEQERQPCSHVFHVPHPSSKGTARGGGCSHGGAHSASAQGHEPPWFSMFCAIVPRGSNQCYLGRKRRGKSPQLSKLGKYWVKQSNANAMFKWKGWLVMLLNFFKSLLFFSQSWPWGSTEHTLGKVTSQLTNVSEATVRQKQSQRHLHSVQWLAFAWR